MDQDDVLHILRSTGALLTDGHYVYTGREHSSMYLAKDKLFLHTAMTSDICREIAVRCAHLNVQVVVGPALGGIVLSQWVARHLSEIAEYEVAAAYAEKVNGVLKLERGYDKAIKNKRVFIVEDTLSTGTSARKVVDAVRNCGGDVIGLGAINNGGNVQRQNVDVPVLVTLVAINAPRYSPESCPLCAQKIPISTEEGHGAEFLAHAHR